MGRDHRSRPIFRVVQCRSMLSAPSQEPEDVLPPTFTEAMKPELEVLAAMGVGEGDFDDPHLPDDAWEGMDDA